MLNRILLCLLLSLSLSKVRANDSLIGKWYFFCEGGLANIEIKEKSVIINELDSRLKITGTTEYSVKKEIFRNSFFYLCFSNDTSKMNVYKLRKLNNNCLELNMLRDINVDVNSMSFSQIDSITNVDTVNINRLAYFYTLDELQKLQSLKKLKTITKADILEYSLSSYNKNLQFYRNICLFLNPSRLIPYFKWSDFNPFLKTNITVEVLISLGYSPPFSEFELNGFIHQVQKYPDVVDLNRKLIF